MALVNKPDESIFASSAKQGEVDNFPDLLRGWGITFEQTQGIPPMEWFNFLFKRLDEKHAYLMQRGLPEWSATQDYTKGSCVQFDGVSYRALKNSKNNHPNESNSQYWVRWGFTLAEIARATLTQYGLTQLYTGYDSQREDLALTPKTAHLLKQFIDSNTRALGNYITNSKKSNAINSNSADTVATSVAVKTAYDLANTKVSKSGDTMTDVLIFDTNNWAQTKYTTQGGIWRFEVHPTGDLATNTARFNYVFMDKTGAERSRIAFNQSTGTSIVAYQGWIADNYLPLTGGSLRGELSLPTLKVTANNTGKGIEIGDDAIVADVKLSNGVGIVGKQQANKGYISFGYNAAASKPLAYIGYDGKK
ncbi:tail fiber protein, partial [Pasteurella bettyae]|uniref:tail fiber protein n=1 Tax=Pasteurella bettyae TaxID=752 RepID=UPI003D2E487A